MSKRPDIGPFGGAGLSHEEHHARMSRILQSGISRKRFRFLVLVYFLETEEQEFFDMSSDHRRDYWKPIDLINKTYPEEEKDLCPFLYLRTLGGGPSFELDTAIFHAMSKCHYDGIDHNRLQVVDGKLILSDYGRQKVESEYISGLSAEEIDIEKKRAKVFVKAIHEIREAEVPK